jgi:hypothetical protein
VPTEWNRLRKRLFATGEYLFGESEGHASGDGARTAGIDPDSTRSLLQRGRLGQHATEHSQLSLRPGSSGRAAAKLICRAVAVDEFSARGPSGCADRCSSGHQDRQARLPQDRPRDATEHPLP